MIEKAEKKFSNKALGSRLTIYSIEIIFERFYGFL